MRWMLLLALAGCSTNPNWCDQAVYYPDDEQKTCATECYRAALPAHYPQSAYMCCLIKFCGGKTICVGHPEIEAPSTWRCP